MSLASTITKPTGQVLDPTAILQALGIRQNMRLADFGCGHGHFVFPAARLVGERGSVFAIDLQHELLEAVDHEAKDKGLMNVRPVWADLEVVGSTKIPDAVVDMVFLINNHVDSTAQSKMFGEAVRILKPGGKCVVIDWLDGNTIPFAPAVAERVAKTDSIKNAHRAGLVLFDEFRPGRYHYGLRFAKP